MDIVFEREHIERWLEARVITSVYSFPIVVIATAHEEVTDHCAYRMTRQWTRRSACGMVDGTDVAIKTRHGIVGRDENCVQTNSSRQVGENFCVVVDGCPKLRLRIHKPWS